MSQYKTKILDPKFRIEFVQQLETRMLKDAEAGKDPKYIDAVIELCDLYEIEPESVSSLITGPIKMHMREEYEERNMIKKEQNWKPLL